MQDPHVLPLPESRPKLRFGALVGAGVALAIAGLTLATCAGQVRRDTEAQTAAVSARPDWWTDADQARTEARCPQFEVYELSPGVAKIVCTGEVNHELP